MAQIHSGVEANHQDNKRELVIAAQSGEKLGKQQLAFNRLVKKIEMMRAQLKDNRSLLDSQMEFYNRHMYPIEMQMNRLRREVLKLLFPYYENKKILPKGQRKSLRELLRGLLSELLSGDSSKPDDEIQMIFGKVHGLSYDEALEQDFESVKDDLENTFRSAGVNIDTSDMHRDMTQEEIARKMHEIHQQVTREKENQVSQKTTGKTTKKQAEKLEKERLIEEARNKNISNIYKQLVKVLHPDREQDPDLKPLKEDLMGQLALAYKNNDLHGLLKLELEWIQREENDSLKLTDEKLKIYNEVLKEQVQELEHEKELLMQEPRYGPIMRYYGRLLYIKRLDLAAEKRNMEEIRESLEVSIKGLNGAAPLTEVKKLVNIYDMQMAFFEMPFSEDEY